MSEPGSEATARRRPAAGRPICPTRVNSEENDVVLVHEGTQWSHLALAGDEEDDDACVHGGTRSSENTQAREGAETQVLEGTKTQSHTETEENEDMRLHEGTCMTECTHVREGMIEGAQAREGIHSDDGIQVHEGTKIQPHTEMKESEDMRLHEGTCMTEGTQVREGIYVKEGIQVHGGTKAQAHEGICADEGIPAHRDAPTGAGFPSLKAGLPDTHTGPWPLTLDDGQCDPGGGSGEPDDPANRARAPERQPLSGGRGAGGDRGHQGRGRRRDPPSRPLPARPQGMPGSATPAGKRSRGSSAQSGDGAETTSPPTVCCFDCARDPDSGGADLVDIIRAPDGRSVQVVRCACSTCPGVGRCRAMLEMASEHTPAMCPSCDAEHADGEPGRRVGTSVSTRIRTPGGSGSDGRGTSGAALGSNEEVVGDDDDSLPFKAYCSRKEKQSSDFLDDYPPQSTMFPARPPRMQRIEKVENHELPRIRFIQSEKP